MDICRCKEQGTTILKMVDGKCLSICSKCGKPKTGVE